MTRYFEPVLDVESRFLRAERFQTAEDRDALAQLRQPRLRELRGQLGLAGQNDLQQLGVVRLEIGKHAHGFEHGVIEILRFVHDQDKTFPRKQFFKQDLVQFAVHGDEAHPLHIDAQLVQDVLDKFAANCTASETKARCA